VFTRSSLIILLKGYLIAMNKVQDVITWYLTTVRVGIIKQQQYRGLYNTGATSDTLRIVRLSDTKQTLVGAGHFRQLVEGRRPGTMPPVDVIREWIESKGLRLNPWAVAVKMMKEGSAIFRGERRGIDIGAEVEEHKEAFYKKLAEAKSEEVINVINRIIKDVNRNR
jgi:hypothetical protein